MTGRSALVLVACALSGCRHRPTQPPPQFLYVPAPAPAPSTNAPLVGALDGVGMMLLLPSDRQRAEIERLRAGLATADRPTDRIQLALLLTLADEAVRDTDEARALLEGHAFDAAGYETLARVVLELLAEREAVARARLDGALALDAERRARQQLADQLEAIKAIETQIEARELGEGASDSH